MNRRCVVDDDIVSRLLDFTPLNDADVARLMLDAADEIVRLRAEVARLGSFLHPIGMVIDTYGTSLTKRARDEN